LIHCDLKPENVLLKTPNRSSIKVIDFGSSCFDDQRIYTYIQSRFYRAPEGDQIVYYSYQKTYFSYTWSKIRDANRYVSFLKFFFSNYELSKKRWSLGCILAELLTGYPLLPGEDENDQLALIVELLGMPNPKLLEGSKRGRNFFSSKGHPRYCQATQLMDGSTVLTGGRSKRGKLRGPPASRTLQSALKNQVIIGEDIPTNFKKTIG
jgi:dual specificity tyrosine-phosphorylation-regulated kinase 2/3/4